MDNGSGLFNETPAVRERAKPRPRRAVGRRLVAAVAVVGGLAAAAYLYPDVTRTVWQKLGGLTQSASARVNADDKGSADSNGGGKAKASAPIAVAIAKAEKAPFPVVVRIFGTVQSPAVVEVGARIASQVTAIPVKDGQMVKAGDLLIGLDDRVARATLERDRAMLAKDQPQLVSTTADLSRAKDLLAKGAGTKQAYDDALAAKQSADAAVAVDQATIDADQLQLDFTHITAPIDGRLGAVQVSVGDLVGPGASTASSTTSLASALVTVTQIDPIWVVFHLPENQLQVFKQLLDSGNPPQIRALKSGTTELIATGVLDFIDSAVDSTSGTITMRGKFANDKAALWPGQYVDLEIDQGVIADATVIPTVAIQPGQDGPFVFLVKPDNTIEVRKTEIARSDGDQSAVRSGLAPGETVVTEGQQKLKTGVTVAPKAPATAQAGD